MRTWKRGLGGVDTCTARAGRGRVHYVRVHDAGGGVLAPANRTLCGVVTGTPAPLPLAGGGECDGCYRAHPVWGSK